MAVLQGQPCGLSKRPREPRLTTHATQDARQVRPYHKEMILLKTYPQDSVIPIIASQLMLAFGGFEVRLVGSP